MKVIGNIPTPVAVGEQIQGNQAFLDTQIKIVDNVDQTRAIAFQVGGVATGTTRTISIPNKDLSLAGTNVEQTFDAPQKGIIRTENDLSFDLTSGNIFTCTPTAGGEITFSGVGSSTGQTGSIIFKNTGAFTITKGSNVKGSPSILSSISLTGTYIISYLCDGTDVYIGNSGLMT